MSQWHDPITMPLAEGAKFLITDGTRRGTVRCSASSTIEGGWMLYGHLGGLNIPGCHPTVVTGDLRCSWKQVVTNTDDIT
jgi:hypothetical protein